MAKPGQSHHSPTDVPALENASTSAWPSIQPSNAVLERRELDTQPGWL
jgi:hypothetical protein